MLKRTNLPSLSVIIPTYNEAKRIQESLPTLCSYLVTAGINAEVIVVNDPGDDNTAQVVTKFSKSNTKPRVILFQTGIRLGKGGSIRVGAEKACGDIVLFLDADLPTDLSNIRRFYEGVRNGADCVYGRRLGNRIYNKQPLIRHILSKAFHFLVLILFRLDYDTQCGFKCARRPVALEIFEHVSLDRLAYDVDFVVEARKRGYSVREFEITWYYHSLSSIRVVKAATRMFLDVLAIWFKNLFPEPSLTENQAEIARFYDNVRGDVRYRATRSMFLPRRLWYTGKYGMATGEALRYAQSSSLNLKSVKVLDVGFGSGNVLEKLVSLGFEEPVGIELSKSSVLFVAKRSRHAVPIRADGRNLPLSSGTFDCVLCIDLLEHLKQPQECLGEILRVLKENGLAIVSTPNASLRWHFIFAFWPRMRREKLEIHHTAIGRNRLIYLMKCSGFNIEKTSSVNLGLLTFVAARKGSSSPPS